MKPKASDVLEVHRGTAPLLVSLPHDGAFIPEELAERMVPAARKAPDTDWWVSRLYAFARGLGATVLVPRHSRYVIDLNRPPDDVSLYPGQNTTGLCPIVMFSGEDLYLPGQAPSEDEIAERRERYWKPYHEALRIELLRLHTLNGRVLLWEGHSIRGEVPFLFEGQLPDLNLGTAAGASCSAATRERLQALLRGQSERSWVMDGRFKGGYITRHYAQPGEGIEAIQLELAQRCYMDETSGVYDDARAASLQTLIAAMIGAAL